MLAARLRLKVTHNIRHTMLQAMSAHLIAKLRERGFEIETDSKGKLVRAQKLLEENKQVALEHFDQILGLVQSSLMTEESVINIIDDTVRSSMDIGQGGLGRVEFRTRVA